MAEQENDFLDRLRLHVNYWLENKGAKNEFAKHLKWIPDVFELMCNLSLEQDVAINDKANLAVAISYFITPFDFFPEALAGVIGYSGDLVLSAMVINDALDHVDESVIKKHWDREEDIRSVVSSILEDSEKMIGKKITSKLTDLVKLG